MIESILTSVAFGLIVGICSGLLGIGGGVIMVPSFRLLFGMSPITCTATSLFTVIPTSISGAITHIRNRTCIPKLGLALGVGGALTSPVGVWLAHISPGWLVMVGAAIVMAYSAITMFGKALKARRATANQKTAPTAQIDKTPEARFTPTRRNLIMGLAIGLLVGVVSGYVGVGGGFIMVPLLHTLINLPMKQASGTSLIAVMLIALPAAIEQGMLGNIDYLVGLATACGSIPGALLGANLVARINESSLRLIFGVFLLVAAVFMALGEIGALG